MDSEYSSLLEKLDRVTACVTRLEARVETLELRLNQVFNTEARCKTLIETSLDYVFRNEPGEIKEEVVKTVVYLVAKYNHEVIISDEELARILIRSYFDLKIDNRKKRMRQEREQVKLVEEISSISLGEEEISSPVTIVGEEELGSPITEEDVTGIETAPTSLSS
jgi:hypothetical protein